MAMERDTKFRISNSLGEIVFQRNPRQYWLTNIEGFSSISTAVYDRQFLNKPGATITGYGIEARRAILEGAVFEPLSVTRRQLLQVCAPGVLTRLEVIEPDLTVYLEFYFEKTPEVAPGDNIQPWQAEIYAEYPYWRAERKNGGAVNLLGIESLFILPKNFGDPAPWMFGYSKSTGGANVHLDGNMPSPFVLTITNTGDTAINSFSITNPVDGSTVKSWGNTFSLTKGDFFILDTYNQRATITIVYSSGIVQELNAFSSLDPTSNVGMMLYPGDNYLEVVITDISGETDVNATALLEIPAGVYSGV